MSPVLSLHSAGVGDPSIVRLRWKAGGGLQFRSFGEPGHGWEFLERGPKTQKVGAAEQVLTLSLPPRAGGEEIYFWTSETKGCFPRFVLLAYSDGGGRGHGLKKA